MTVLHHRIVAAAGASPTKRMLLLHGIYGAGRNWGTVARRLVNARPGWSVALADLRSHGRSPRLAPHTVEACAGDLPRFEEQLGHAADAGQNTGRVFLHHVEGGHRVHTDNPDALHALLAASLPAARKQRLASP